MSLAQLSLTVNHISDHNRSLKKLLVGPFAVEVVVSRGVEGRGISSS